MAQNRLDVHGQLCLSLLDFYIMTLSDTYCTSTYCIVHCISYNFIVLILHDFVSQFEILQAFFFTLLYEYDMICNWPIFQTTFVPFFKPKIDQFPKIALHLFS